MTEFDGYIRLYRKILECEVLKDKVFDRTHAWLDLLIMANYETEDGVERGQCRISYRWLANRWGWDVKAVYRFIDKLSENGMVSTELSTDLSTPLSTLLTIVKYGFYQGGDNTFVNANVNTFVNTEEEKRKEAKEKRNAIIRTPNKYNTADSAEDAFEELWAIYPRKEGKRDALRHFKAALKDGSTVDEIREGLERYLEHIRANGTQPKYIAQGSTWFCQRRWEDELTNTPAPRPEPKPTSHYDESRVVHTAFTKDVMQHENLDYEALFGSDL